MYYTAVMKIVLIGNTHTSAVARLTEEAAVQNIDFIAVSLQSLIFAVKDNVYTLTSTTHGDIASADCYMFRGIGEADQETMIIAKHLLRHGATIIEEKTANGALAMDKIFLQAIEASISTPDYYMIQGIESLRKIAASITYPAVMKSTIGSMGKNVALVRSKSELFAKYKALGSRVIIQKYLAVDFDVRAIVVGGKYVGAYQRTRTDGEFRMNRPGNTKKEISLSPEVIALCERTAQSQTIEIAGIDLIKFEDIWYVLEINTSPQFKKFEEYTNTNVAKLILEYAVKKSSHSEKCS